MFAWLRKQITAAAERKLEALLAERQRLSAELVDRDGELPDLTEEQRERLSALARELDPDVLRQHSLFSDQLDLDDRSDKCDPGD